MHCETKRAQDANSVPRNPSAKITLDIKRLVLPPRFIILDAFLMYVQAITECLTHWYSTG